MQDLSKMSDEELLKEYGLTILKGTLDGSFKNMENNGTCNTFDLLHEELLRRLSLADKFTWQDIKYLPSAGDFLFFNKDYVVNTMQAGKVKDGDLLVIGHHFAYDQKKPTHWMPLPPRPENKE